MCPDGIAPCKMCGGTAFGAAWMGMTEESWICSGALAAEAETGICMDTATGKTNYVKFKGCVGRIVNIQDLTKKCEHRQLLSPSPLSAKA